MSDRFSNARLFGPGDVSIQFWIHHKKKKKAHDRTDGGASLDSRRSGEMYVEGRKEGDVEGSASFDMKHEAKIRRGRMRGNGGAKKGWNMRFKFKTDGCRGGSKLQRGRKAMGGSQELSFCRLRFPKVGKPEERKEREDGHHSGVRGDMTPI